MYFCNPSQIIKLYDVFARGSNIALVLEFMKIDLSDVNFNTKIAFRIPESSFINKCSKDNNDYAAKGSEILS